ncbi:acyl-CoA thioesterase [Aquimarina pacifica]|uniref:acyl-CoA thioesterase n=1 Tax=Aquimarina pacifica TaxID=1296415 RepID=UPI000470548C|nr:acyl-CoA thioesterase [Aquimarina pacifica]
MESRIFLQQFTVPETAIDEMGHVNNVVYLQWIQDIAKKHWESKTNEATRSSFVWVVLNHNIDYHHPAYKNDPITIKTWIHHSRGAKSERRTQIINTTTEKTLVSAKTTWCFLRKETLKPARITKEISNLFI